VYIGVMPGAGLRGAVGQGRGKTCKRDEEGAKMVCTAFDGALEDTREVEETVEVGAEFASLVASMPAEGEE
jgi:hypothetical protein